MKLRDLLARRDAIRSDLRTILEKHDGSLPDDAQQRADDLQAEAERLNDLEKRIAALDDMDRRAGGRPITEPSSGSSSTEVRAFSDMSARLPENFDGMVWRAADGSRVPILEARHKLRDFIAVTHPASELGLGGFCRALRYGAKSDLERRVLAESSVGAGGAFVPSPLSAEVIDLLRPQVVSLRAGARIIPMTTQTLRFARNTADPTGAWRAENASVATSVPTFDNLTLSAQSWAVIVQASRELLEDAPNIDAALRNIFARSAAVALDAAILNGAGHGSHQPAGISGTSGIQVVSMGTNGAAIADWTPVLDAVGSLEAANANTVTALVMAPRTARVLYGLVDTLGQPLRRVDRIANVPMLVTTGMGVAETQGSASTASSILLGDFSEVYVGMRTELVISVLQELYAANGQVGFVLWLRADVAIARPAAMARVEGIIPA
ncbi:MAG TPA: phage major capsid protein [Acetobacteraceae bacterium]|nr:phage major capsid protein [Acetobacteraceae bacterium]